MVIKSLKMKPFTWFLFFFSLVRILNLSKHSFSKAKFIKSSPPPAHCDQVTQLSSLRVIMREKKITWIIFGYEEYSIKSRTFSISSKKIEGRVIGNLMSPSFSNSVISASVWLMFEVLMLSSSSAIKWYLVTNKKFNVHQKKFANSTINTYLVKYHT